MCRRRAGDTERAREARRALREVAARLEGAAAGDARAEHARLARAARATAGRRRRSEIDAEEVANVRAALALGSCYDEGCTEVLMRALRFFASLSLGFVPALMGCSLVLDTDPPDPSVPPDLGVIDSDSGPRDLGSPDLGRPDADSSDGHVGLPDGDAVDAGCTSNAACDDGVFCNGVEQCVAGTCVVDAVACPDTDGFDCTVPSCDPTLDACVETANAAICAVGSYCDPASGCTVTPDCTHDTDCVAPDACTVVACVGGACSFSPLDCAAALPALSPSDCRVASCEPLLGCFYAPVHSRCDDGVGCTYDYCRDVGGAGTPGTCGHEPQHSLCDDLSACTLDTCDPAAPCTDPGGVSSGCRHTPDDAACRTLVADLIAIHPGLACASPVCIGPTAGNPAGCGFDGGCASGQTCAFSGGTGSYSCTSPSSGVSCPTDVVCNDGDPCNGVEACIGGHCAASLISPCHPTPSGPSLLGTCSFAPDGVICAPLSELCAAAGGP